MKILCFGSLNIDHTYMLNHFVQKGETISSTQLSNFSGGKGLNQSIALARAGADVLHAGAIGEDGKELLHEMEKSGVDIGLIQILPDVATGHAIIQIDQDGDNCIILYGGANQKITIEYVDYVIEQFHAGDLLVLQNEINNLPYIIEKANEKGMKIVLNPSPMDYKIFELPLELVDLFILNEVEARQLIGVETMRCDGEELLTQVRNKYQTAEIVLTLGAKGAIYDGNGKRYFQEAMKEVVVDTTAAGDTFTGYLLAEIIKGKEIGDAMKYAATAAGIAIGKKGASSSIPYIEEVEKRMTFHSF